MTLDKYLSTFAKLLSAGIAAGLLKKFLDHKIDFITALCVAAVFGAFLQILFELLIVDAPTRFRVFRRLHDSRVILEGIWEQVIPDLTGSPISVCRIYYNPDEKKYIFRGKNYAPDGETRASFISRFADIDIGKSKMEFMYTADIKWPDSNSILGIGVMDFDIDGENCDIGKGYFNDADTGIRNYNFTLRRIPEKERLEAIGSKRESLPTHVWQQLALDRYKRRDLKQPQRPPSLPAKEPEPT